jgi:hypothetical protein
LWSVILNQNGKQITRHSLFMTRLSIELSAENDIDTIAFIMPSVYLSSYRPPRARKHLRDVRASYDLFWIASTRTAQLEELSLGAKLNQLR